MKRKMYQVPTMTIVKLQHQGQILQGSPYSMEATGSREQLSDGTNDLGWGASGVKAHTNYVDWDAE